MMKYIIGCLLFISVALVAAQQGDISITPYPQQISTGSGTININPDAFKVVTNLNLVILPIAIKRYQNLFFLFNSTASSAPAVTLNINVQSSNEELYLGVSEQYTITVSTNGMTINADTTFGAMRALETFAQLIVFNPSTQTYSIPYVPISITDYPRFQWRGFMIDTARHFLPKDYILHIIDALGYNKFNVLHWHIVDAQSFPIESTVYPALTQAAYYPTAVYSHADVQEIVAYALTYGIRVIPEFDLPGHSAAWGVGYPDLIANCPEYAYNVNNIAMDISQPGTYTFLKNFFAEMITLFPDTYFHTGGDEVVFGCWQEDPTIQQWMNNNNFNVYAAEQYFENQVEAIVTSLNRTRIIWNDPIQNGVTVSTDTLVQIWNSYTVVQQIVDAGLQAIVSTSWYLDKQDPDNHLHYEFEDTWQDFYMADPYDNITSGYNLIIGGEGAMWAEQVNQVNWDVRVWPRSIAIAERLWSDQSVNSVANALPRIEVQSCMMANRGVASGPLRPDFCFMEQFNSVQGPIHRLSKSQIKSINSIIKSK